jgi:hypothetical protein
MSLFLPKSRQNREDILMPLTHVHNGHLFVNAYACFLGRF